MFLSQEISSTKSFLVPSKSAQWVAEKEVQRRYLARIMLLIMSCFLLTYLPETISHHSVIGLAFVLLSLAMCGIALLFSKTGRISEASILLIVAIDLGCGFMLLAAPRGLDVANMPIFDVLIFSELVAVSLLPPVSVFPIALGNILFILADIGLQPHTPALQQLLASGMAYTVVIQPIGLQLLVAIVAYTWVIAASNATKRAHNAEQEAEMLRREVERQQQVSVEIDKLAQMFVRIANGDYEARVSISEDHKALWQIALSLNFLLARLQKADQREEERQWLQAQEKQRLQAQVSFLTEALDVATNGRN